MNQPRPLKARIPRPRPLGIPLPLPLPLPPIDQAGPTSDYTANFRYFNRKEQDDVRGAMAKEAKADLRAVHYELQYDQRQKITWQSDQQAMNRTGSNTSLATRAQMTRELACGFSNTDQSHGLQKERSGYQAAFRKYSTQEMEKVQGAMNEEG